jgi:hypothetical protein
VHGAWHGDALLGAPAEARYGALCGRERLTNGVGHSCTGHRARRDISRPSAPRLLGWWKVFNLTESVALNDFHPGATDIDVVAVI